jgi:hypothetical protein
MAKSIRLSDIDVNRAYGTAPLSRGSFWENWFDGEPQTPRHYTHRPLDEHSIWEKAVNLELLAMEENGK